MKKFSKIVESKLNKDELISKLGISSDDLDEVFIDMVDLGYDMTSEDIYISSSTGYPHRSSSSSKEFYPGLEINLYRKTGDSSGNCLKFAINNCGNLKVSTSKPSHTPNRYV